MGRTVEHEDRLQSIEEGEERTFDELHEGLMASHQHMVQTLNAMHDDDLQREGVHIVVGPQSLLDFIERFMVNHDYIHAEQAAGLLFEIEG